MKVAPITRDRNVDPDLLEAEGHEHIARGNAMIAEAKRRRSGARTAEDTPASDWVPRKKTGLATKTINALIRERAVEATKLRGRVYVSKASLNAYLRAAASAKPSRADDEDAALRSELGLGRRAS